MKKDGTKLLDASECQDLHRKLQLLLSVYVDDIKIAGNTQNMPRLWAQLQEKVKLDDPVPLADQVHLGCTDRAAQVNNRNVMEKQDVKTEDVTVWSYDMEGHGQKCVVGRYCELAHKTVDRHHNVSTLCLDDHQVKPEDLEDLVSDCTYMIALSNNWKTRPTLDSEFLGQIISQSGTDAILDKHDSSATFITQHTTKQQCHVGQQAINCKLGLHRFCRKSDRLRINIGWRSVYLWIIHVCTNFMASQKQSAVSHSSIEADSLMQDYG